MREAPRNKHDKYEMLRPSNKDLQSFHRQVDSSRKMSLISKVSITLIQNVPCVTFIPSMASFMQRGPAQIYIYVCVRIYHIILNSPNTRCSHYISHSRFFLILQTRCRYRNCTRVMSPMVVGLKLKRSWSLTLLLPITPTQTYFIPCILAYDTCRVNVPADSVHDKSFC